MPISFFAVPDRKRANGFLVVGNKVWPARSGRNLSDVSAERLAFEDGKKKRKLAPGEHAFIDFRAEKGDVPPGTYEIGKPLGLSHDNLLTMTDGTGNPRFRKFPIIPVGNSRLIQNGKVIGVKDDRYPGVPRTSLLFHYDGDVIGSAGCIVYDTLEVQDALIAAINRGDRSVTVVHVATAAEARSRADQAAASFGGSAAAAAH